MIRKPIAYASVSAILLAAACGDSGQADDAPADPADMSQADTAPMDAGEAARPSESASADGSAGMTDDGRVARDAMANGNGSMADAGSDMAGTAGAGSNDEVAPLLDRLEGDWVSGEDDRSEMSIIDGTATMMYDGEVLSIETLEAVDTCPDATGEASESLDLFTMTSDETGETLCYGVISLGNDRLELTSYPRGNTLTYTRQPGTDVLDAE